MALMSSLLKEWFCSLRPWLEIRWLRVADNAMAQILNRGELVLVDSSPEHREISRLKKSLAKVYLVRESGVFVFRRLVLLDSDQPDKLVLLYISNDTRMRPFVVTVPREKLGQYVVGPAVWVGKELV